MPLRFREIEDIRSQCSKRVIQHLALRPVFSTKEQRALRNLLRVSYFSYTLGNWKQTLQSELCTRDNGSDYLATITA